MCMDNKTMAASTPESMLQLEPVVLPAQQADDSSESIELSQELKGGLAALLGKRRRERGRGEGGYSGQPSADGTGTQVSPLQCQKEHAPAASPGGAGSLDEKCGQEEAEQDEARRLERYNQRKAERRAKRNTPAALALFASLQNKPVEVQVRSPLMFEVPRLRVQEAAYRTLYAVDPVMPRSLNKGIFQLPHDFPQSPAAARGGDLTFCRSWVAAA
eukprot:TRINITY_DN25815_c0_g1_i1.p2 TRINITY_DN25815_c0_g1~~TRINITY_DN25815_c0_g1_i1.p2  ORF type:complete len:216 (+),score=57.02 TRINITY_DN25815_c0_g1_i1:152-799(+)